MATQSNKEAFLGGFKKLLNEQWQADVRLKAGDSDETTSIFAHKLVLVSLLPLLFYLSSSNYREKLLIV